MKKAQLKEAIKNEIKSVLSEGMTDKEREDKLQQAKRGGGKEKPLRKLAATGKKEDSLKEISLISEKKLGTSDLNNFLDNVLAKHPHPNKNGRQVKIKYITQISSKPPSFVIFTNHPDFIKESYKRYLINEIRKEFGFEGITIRLDIKGSKNPYSK